MNSGKTMISKAVFGFLHLPLSLALFLNPADAVSQSSDFEILVGLYIQAYKDIALKEMMVYRIPASITLAQGIHESNAGTSRLAKEANNHFGIKCHKGWTGKTFFTTDDYKDECFRKYDSPLESFRDHSYFLTQRERYKSLFELDVTDYRGWARGLKSAGYATNPRYAEILIATIEKYMLDRFDNADFMMAFGDSLHDLDDPAKQAWLRKFMVFAIGPGNRKVFSNNGLQMIIARRKDNLDIIARDFDISPGRLMKYNDLENKSALVSGRIVYLEQKKRKAAARDHVFAEGETLYGVSQLYGIKLKMIYKRNDIPEGVEPRPGMVLKLR